MGYQAKYHSRLAGQKRERTWVSAVVSGHSAVNLIWLRSAYTAVEVPTMNA